MLGERTCERSGEMGEKDRRKEIVRKRWTGSKKDRQFKLKHSDSLCKDDHFDSNNEQREDVIPMAFQPFTSL